MGKRVSESEYRFRIFGILRKLQGTVDMKKKRTEDMFLGVPISV